MKKILLFAMFALLLVACSSETEEQRKIRLSEVYYLDEDFILMDAKEEVVDGDYKIRTWFITRLTKEHPDTAYQAEIISKVATNFNDNCNCGTDDFVITNELWYNKPIGSTLHFDFIRKDRFFKVATGKVSVVHETPEIKEPNPYNAIPVPIDNMDKMEIELNILKLERELTLLKEELKKYN